jgi:hypothetical protein
MLCEHCNNQATHKVTILGVITQWLCAIHYAVHNRDSSEFESEVLV